jgi:hypothetical protein
MMRMHLASRGRDLLTRKEISDGCYVHVLKSEQQLRGASTIPKRLQCAPPRNHLIEHRIH